MKCKKNDMADLKGNVNVLGGVAMAMMGVYVFVT